MIKKTDKVAGFNVNWRNSTLSSSVNFDEIKVLCDSQVSVLKRLWTCLQIIN